MIVYEIKYNNGGEYDDEWITTICILATKTDADELAKLLNEAKPVKEFANTERYGFYVIKHDVLFDLKTININKIINTCCI